MAFLPGVGSAVCRESEKTKTFLPRRGEMRAAGVGLGGCTWICFAISAWKG
jgi:hypothetical protein